MYRTAHIGCHLQPPNVSSSCRTGDRNPLLLLSKSTAFSKTKCTDLDTCLQWSFAGYVDPGLIGFDFCLQLAGESRVAAAPNDPHQHFQFTFQYMQQEALGKLHICDMSMRYLFVIDQYS